ncbi:MAG: SDR family NAD(P)-dependent oxidoreductase [Planctomycetota bacterium]
MSCWAPTAVVLAGRDANELAGLAGELDAHSFVLDPCEAAEVQQCVRTVVENHGRIDGVANCVGSLILKPAHLTTPEEFEATLRTNLGSAFAAVRAAAPAMRKTGGSIVLMSSAAARIGLANHEAIAAAKAGVAGLARSAAATYASWGVRVNVVAPGLTRTPLAERITSNEAALKASNALHALGRIGEPEEVASLVAWLLDPAQRWITGQEFGADGGLATLKTRSSR